MKIFTKKSIEEILLEAFKQNHFSRKLIKQIKKQNINLTCDEIIKFRCENNLSFHLIKEEHKKSFCSILKCGNSIYEILRDLEELFGTENYYSLKLIDYSQVLPQDELNDLYFLAETAIRNKTEETYIDFLKHLNEINKKYIFIYYEDFIEEVYKAVFPKFGQKKKGLDRLQFAFDMLYYLTQKEYLHRELLAESNIARRTETVITHIIDDDIIGFKWRLSTIDKEKLECVKASQIDFGLGKGIYPKDKIPLRPFRKDCTCYLMPKVG